MTESTHRFANAVIQTKAFALKDVVEDDEATSQATPDDESATQPQNPNNEEASWKKRHDDVKTFLNKKTEDFKHKETELVQQVTQLQQKLTKAESQKSYPKTEEEVKLWMTNYPDLSQMLETIILMKNEESTAELKKEQKAFENKLKEFAAEKGRTELRKIHPDADELESDPKFAAWYNEQPVRIQELISSSDVREIARGIDIYKKDVGLTNKATQDKQKDNSKMVNTGSSKPVLPEQGKIWLESEIQSLKGKALVNAMPDIEKAQREGRITYDISNNF